MIDLNKYKTLFLDRDGVINVERKNDYVKNISEFVFEEKATEALNILSQIFDRMLIVTNQRGVGRSVMSQSDLDSVHRYLRDELQKINVEIDKIYTCTDLTPDSINRKPNVGMAFQAVHDFPDIDFSSSVMVGNSKSDIEFGRKLGMFTVLVGQKYPQDNEIYKNINAYFSNLYEFALSLLK